MESQLGADYERKSIRILIADDHYVVRMGLVALVETEPDLPGSSAKAADGRRWSRCIRSSNPISC